MSALRGKADLAQCWCEICFCLKADILRHAMDGVRAFDSDTPIDDTYSPFARAVRAGRPHSRRTSSSCARKTAS
jgi:hypothetical protein